jgi:hypothetical protein
VLEDLTEALARLTAGHDGLYVAGRLPRLSHLVFASKLRSFFMLLANPVNLGLATSWGSVDI